MEFAGHNRLCAGTSKDYIATMREALMHAWLCWQCADMMTTLLPPQDLGIKSLGYVPKHGDTYYTL